MIRLFAAVELPDDAVDMLSKLQSGLPRARWSPPENLHVTLAFFGSVAEPLGEELSLELGRIQVAPFSIRIAGIDTFDGSRQHESSTILFAGVERTEPLVRLSAKAENIGRRLGIDIVRRKYTPHITLARIRDLPSDRIGNYMRRHSLFKIDPFEVRRFTLFESITGSAASVYHPLVHYDLAAAPISP